MDIGFFTDSYFPEIDGVTYTIELWREALERDGHRVYVIYPDGAYHPRDREIPVRSVSNPFYPGYRIPLARRPSTLPELDIVHCHGPAPVGRLGRYYARKRDLPSIYTHHTPLEAYFRQSVRIESVANALAKLYVPLETSFLRGFDVVTASTDRLERDVSHVQLPVGIDMDRFEPTEINWFPDRTVIGYSGRLSMEKHVDEILGVAAALPEYDFVVVGEGPRRARLQRNAPDNVFFRPFLPRDELADFYSSIDVFVTASTADTLGLSPLEANACGTPVAAPDVAPFDRTIGAQNGRRFVSGDLESMRDAIEDCLDWRYDTRAAVAQFDVTRTLAHLTSIYDEVRSSSDGTSTEVVSGWSVTEESVDPLD